MKRLFAALKIYPDNGFLLSYRNLKAGFRHEPIKWVEEYNIHITLKFFGETEESRIPEICSTLRELAGKRSPMTIRLTGLGIFGSSYAPKVIWVGIDPVEELSELMKQVHTGLAGAGFEPDRQNLVPHLTLGRVKLLHDKILFRRTLDQFRTMASLPLPISEIILYESILRREGPQYIALDKFPLEKKLP